MRRLRVAPEAQRDIDGLLAFSEDRFGAAAADRYRNLIDTALRDLRADPDRPGVRAIDAFGRDLRSLHLNTLRSSAPAGQRVSRPRHLLVFRADDERLTLFRVLDDRMDLPAHLRTIDDVF